jgi:hypothetical protein
MRAPAADVAEAARQVVVQVHPSERGLEVLVVGADPERQRAAGHDCRFEVADVHALLARPAEA